MVAPQPPDAGSASRKETTSGRDWSRRRTSARRLLQSRPDVVSFRDAEPGSGGWGATLVVLAPSRAE